MGLDMYLYANKYVNKVNWGKSMYEDDSWAETEEFTALVNTLGCRDSIRKEDVTGIYVKIPIGYWRKANAIHGWFVREMADGRDECQDIYCGKENLEELLNTCRNVLEKNDNEFAKENLPTCSGFFFGTNEYDEWYWDDIKKTIEILENALKSDYESFIYQASW